MRVRRNPVPVEGDAEAWGPATRERFKELAGSAFVREQGEDAVVVARDGREDVIHPGWIVVVPDGSTEPQFSSAEQLGDGELCNWSPAGEDWR